MSGMRTMTATCNHCGMTQKTTGREGTTLEMLARLDAAHDALMPGCPAVADRASRADQRSNQK